MNEIHVSKTEWLTYRRVSRKMQLYDLCGANQASLIDAWITEKARYKNPYRKALPVWKEYKRGAHGKYAPFIPVLVRMAQEVRRGYFEPVKDLPF